MSKKWFQRRSDDVSLLSTHHSPIWHPWINCIFINEFHIILPVSWNTNPDWRKERKRNIESGLRVEINIITKSRCCNVEHKLVEILLSNRI